MLSTNGEESKDDEINELSKKNKAKTKLSLNYLQSPVSILFFSFMNQLITSNENNETTIMLKNCITIFAE